MRKPPTTRLYCEIVFLIGLICSVLVAGGSDFSWITRRPVAFTLLGLGVLLGEMLPIRIPRRGAEEELTFSATFALALLLLGGLAPAILPLALASLLQDVRARKPFWRLRFNLGQYTVSMVLAHLVIRALTTHPAAGAQSAGTDQLPALLLGVAAFFLANEAMVGTAVALHQRMQVSRYFRNDLGYVLATDGIVVLVAPIVLAVSAFSIALVPLCLAPILAVYSSIRRGVRSEHAARHDVLTGLPNRAGFQDAAVAAIESEHGACVLLMDLDRFKEINDTLGHHAGDGLLVGVAARFQEAIETGAVIARLGGDEFAVVNRSCDRGGAEALAQRLADSLAEPFELDGIVLDVKASIGIALHPEHGDSLDTLLQKADVAMYHAKQTRIDWSLYEERHDHHSPARLSLATELRTAVEGGEEIVPIYQPEVDLNTGEVVAVEALARWRHPRLGVLSPDEFIELAEDTKLIKPLTHRVIEASLRQLSAWRRHGTELTVAVNVSAPVLVERNFADVVMGALQDAGIPPTLLKLEVTESALMGEPIVARAVLAELSSFGIEISIDDFGTGYSSLSYLADLPVSEVKIDRSFVEAMDSGVGTRIIVSSTIDLAHNLGLRAVAEGVSDLAMLPRLEALGCDVVQGFAIARPMSGEQVAHWVARFDRRTVARSAAAIGVPRSDVGEEAEAGPVAERVAAAARAAEALPDSLAKSVTHGRDRAGTLLPTAPSVL